MQLSDDESTYMNHQRRRRNLKQLEKEIKELTRKSTRIYSEGNLNGRFGYYTLSSNYGGRTDPVYGGYAFHNGIDILPKRNQCIAAADGEVIVSGYVNGYGYTIIRDHGSGLTTLYGHNSQLVASVGQFVQRGQVVAKGKYRKSTGNHSHFEVRVNGSHTILYPIYLNKGLSPLFLSRK